MFMFVCVCVWQMFFSAEELHTTQGSSTGTLRAKMLPTWWLGTWNMHSVVDTDGLVVKL